MSYKKHHPLVFKGFATTIPLGIAYISAFLEKEGHEIKILDYQIKNYDLSEEIKSFNPEFLGVSICSPAFTHATEIAREARRLSPKISIIAGGCACFRASQKSP